MHDDKVIHPAAGTEEMFRQRRRLGIVFNVNRNREQRAQLCAHRDVAPSQPRCQHQMTGLIDQPVLADADAANLAPSQTHLGQQRLHAVLQIAERRVDGRTGCHLQRRPARSIQPAGDQAHAASLDGHPDKHAAIEIDLQQRFGTPCQPTASSAQPPDDAFRLQPGDHARDGRGIQSGQYTQAPLRTAGLFAQCMEHAGGVDFANQRGIDAWHRR